MLVEECTLIGKQFETIRYMESLDFAWPCEKLHGSHKILQGNTVLPQRECEANRRETHLHRAVLTFSFRSRLTSTQMPNFLQVFQRCHRGLKLSLIRLSVIFQIRYSNRI